MDIYEGEGADAVVDLAKAARELAKSGAINLESTRRATVAEITAAALLDIASSLRLVAAEAGLAMAGSGMFAEADDEPVTDETRDFLVIGDLVHLRGQDRTGEVVKLGFSEDEVTADVVFVGDDGPTRLFGRDLIRLRGDEKSADLVGEEMPAGEDGVPIPGPADYAAADEHDDEFEGDDFTEAENALDALRELEKKTAKKKGKKS